MHAQQIHDLTAAGYGGPHARPVLVVHRFTGLAGQRHGGWGHGDVRLDDQGFEASEAQPEVVKEVHSRSSGRLAGEESGGGRPWANTSISSASLMASNR